MPANTPDLQLIQDRFLEVAFRANRLREWTGLDVPLQKLDGRFSEFHTVVKEIIAQGNNAGMPRLQDLWFRCRTFELEDLKNWVAGARYISKTTWRAPVDGAPLPADSLNMPVVNVNDLFQLVDRFTQGLADEAPRALIGPCMEFRIALNGLHFRRQQSISEEITELCSLTSRLEERLRM